MKIADAADRSGLSAHTIRYYEAAGLLPNILRGSDGHRRFSQENINWLTLLASLRETGMPITDMKHFARLYSQGDATVSDRKRMLQQHQIQLEANQDALRRCHKLLSLKLARYDEILGETS